MKKILIIAPYFEPSFKFGGPIRSLKNLIDLLHLKHEFYIVTRDRDFGDDKQFESVPIGSWIKTDKNVNVFYLDKQVDFSAQINVIRKSGPFSVIYLNSFFDYDFSIRFQLYIFFLKKFNFEKVILAPRGELSFGAMKIKPLKKNIFLGFYKLFGLSRKIVYHFTAEEELAEARNFIGNVKSIVVPNMHERIPEFYHKEKNEGEVVVGFLSRISVKKNLITIINALKRINDCKVVFKIAGFKEDISYWNECEIEINSLPPNISVEYVGALNRNEVSAFLRSIHVFILPTFNENYGHSIVEAMVNSTVIMISDQTPWSDVSNFGGFVGKPTDIDFFANSLMQVSDFDSIQFNSAAKSTYTFCKNKLGHFESLVSKTFSSD